MKNCLQALGRPLPTTRFDLFASLCWNLVRQLLHRVYVGRLLYLYTNEFWYLNDALTNDLVLLCRWLARRAGRLCGNITAEDASKSAKDAADVYHKLHQLHLTGYLTGHVCSGQISGRLTGINLGLCTVNVAEAAGKRLPANVLAEIYATNAITARMHYPSVLKFLAVR